MPNAPIAQGNATTCLDCTVLPPFSVQLCSLHAAAGEMRNMMTDLLNVALTISNAKHAGQRISNDLWSDLYWRSNQARALLAKTEA